MFSIPAKTAMAITLRKIGKITIPDNTALLDEIDSAMAEWSRKVQRDYERTVLSWNTPVRFRVRRQRTNRYIQVSVYTDSQIYYWTDQGTRPHPIAARNAPFLRYQRLYKRKTRVGVIGSTAGGKYGPWAQRRQVRHPGTQARRFTQTIARRKRPALIRSVNKSIVKWARRSRNG